MASPARYTLSEFSRIAGVSVRNIRAYIHSGAVPRPLGRTRGAWYTEEHLTALRAHLVRKATSAMARSEPAVAVGDVAATPASPAVWVELAPDVKVLLLPDAHGHSREQLLHAARMMAMICGSILNRPGNRGGSLV